MPVRAITWSRNKAELCANGIVRLRRFCEANGVPVPCVNVVKDNNWYFDACAYYRPDTEQERKWLGRGMGRKGYGVGINICLERCQVPCPETPCRNWTWPGGVIDREPYGVIAHELAHHLDWLASETKGRYFGSYSRDLRRHSGEAPLTGYCPDDAEWFAEMGRLFVTNHSLLRQLRPRTYALIMLRWKPVSPDDWRVQLGRNVPSRVVRSLYNKGAV